MTKKDENIMQYCFAEIDNKAPEFVQLMRTIKAEHGFYGSVVVSKDDLRKFKENFDTKKRRTEIAVDYSHMAHLEAAGWIKSIELREDDSELWIQVEWTKEAAQKIEDKQYRYLSADFSMKYIDEETGEVIGQVLHGAGLTNRPFIRGMKAILSETNGLELSEEQISKIRDIMHGKDLQFKEKDMKMDFKEMLKAAKGLNEHEKKELLDALGMKPETEVKASELTVKLSEVETENAKLKAENAKLAEDKAKADKEAKFNVMLAEGKVVEAQREPYLLGDLDKFASLKADVNLSAIGSEAPEGKEGEPKTASEAAQKLSEMANKLATEKGIEFSDAMSEVIHANEKLYELSEQ